MKMTIHIETVTSKRDIYGNTYSAMIVTHLASSRQVFAKVSCGGNIGAMKRCWGRIEGWDDTIQIKETELKIREFNRFAKDLPYAGCGPEELVAYVKGEFRKQGVRFRKS